MMAFLRCKMWEGIQRDLEKGGLLGGIMVGVDGVAGVDGTVEMRVVLESSP